MSHLGHSFVWCRKLRPRKVDQKCTYQHEAITSRSRQLLMMGTWLPETCWEKSRREIKNTKVTSSWFFLSTLNFQLGRVLTLWRLKTPIVDYRTANLQSCILYIYSTNTVTEYFKRGIYSPSLPLQNAGCFIIRTYLVRVLFTFYIQSVLKLKKNNSGSKRLSWLITKIILRCTVSNISKMF